jgi:hypothetical protein
MYFDLKSVGCRADRWALEPNKKSIPESWLEALRCIMEEHIPPHHLAVPDSDILDMAQLAPTTQLSELIELACRWNKSFGIDLGNVEIRVLIKEP